jgi:lysophospholipase L1-like esterase
MKKYLLKICVVFISVLLFLSNSVVGQYNPETKWGESIAKYERQDSISMPEPGGILLLGSSSFTIWKDVGDNFPGKNIVNRGFGGSQMSDVLYFKERLILPYQPVQLILYEGENDIANGKMPDTIFSELVQLVNWTKTHFPEIKISILSMKPSPRRWEFRETMLEMNKKLNKYAEETENIDFINIWDPLLGSNGKPVKDNYLEDLLHLNANGYKIWQKAISPFL